MVREALVLFYTFQMIHDMQFDNVDFGIAFKIINFVIDSKMCFILIDMMVSNSVI